jgi:hypothetical protein
VLPRTSNDDDISEQVAGETAGEDEFDANDAELSEFGLSRRGEAWMRFHPNSRASIDQRPGPNIASAPPMVAANTVANRSSEVRILEISIAATAIPARGVQSPMTRRTAGPARQAKMSAACHGGSLQSCPLALTSRTDPTTRRIASNPMPGQPPANVE